MLTDAVLNRTTLARQLLLERSSIGALRAVHHVVGLQAQAANSPYLSLWSRLSGFHQRDLTALLEQRQVVRAGILRGTQHLVTAADFPWLRSLIQPVADRGRQAAFGRRIAGVPLPELADVARSLLRGRTLTRPQLRDLLAERWPDHDALALAWAVQSVVPVVHPPPNGTWGRGGATPFTLAEEWLGVPLDPAPSPEPLVLRYLAAYGPASVADLQTWSGLTRLAEVVERLDLRTYTDERGHTLYDLPDAALSDVDVPAPVRFLPEFDNLIVAYADRERLMSAEHRRRVCVGSMVAATILVDGRVAGMWRLKRGVVELELFDGVPADALAGEAGRLRRFVDPTHANVTP